MIQAVAISLKDANEFVDKYHRHHCPVVRDKFRVAATENGEIIGVAQVARPVSRIQDDGMTVEVVRLCTLGGNNVCSFLYSRCARAAKELGFRRIITYILESEPGTSLAAAGWKETGIVKGKSWSTKSRPRNTKAPTVNKKRFEKKLN